MPEPLPYRQERALPGGDRRITGGWSFVSMYLFGFLVAATAPLVVDALR
jgi:hypothetical protein